MFLLKFHGFMDKKIVSYKFKGPTQGIPNN